MHAYAAAGAAFLLAVLWFDLMFDVQTIGRKETLPFETLETIGSYYRRVTTDARPMNRLVGLVMLLTLIALSLEIVLGERPAWVPVTSLALAVSAMGLATGRTVRNAIALGRAKGSAAVRSGLARSVCRDHLYCLFAMAVVLALQLAA